jgi:hypothetical protein
MALADWSGYMPKFATSSNRTQRPNNAHAKMPRTPPLTFNRPWLGADATAAVLRTFAEDMSVQSVATSLGVPYVTAHRRVEAAKRAASRLLTGYEHE